jgi:subfamily B ATP-binding cassette protein MsbA
MKGMLRNLARSGVFSQPRLMPLLLLGGSAAALCVVAQIALPLAIGSIIDKALLARDVRSLVVRVLVLAGAAILTVLGQGVYETTFARLGEGGRAELQARVLARLHALPIAFFDQERSGRLLSLLSEDAASAARLTYLILSEAWFSTVQVGLTLIVVASRYGLAVLAAPALIPIYMALPLLFSGRTRRAAREALASTADVHTALHESVQAVREVRIFGRESWALERVRKLLAADVTRQVRLVFLRSVSGLDYAVYFLVVSVVYWRGGLAVLGGRLTVGGLVALVSLLGMMAPPVRRLARLGADYHRLSAALERIEELPEAEVEQQPADGGAELAPGPHRVSFDRVEFAYGAAAPALRNVSFAADPGERVAIVGPSGAGKSTLVGLLARLYEPQRGSISIDGRDLQSYSIASLRREIGFVLQDTILFAGTVRENIRFGKLDADDEEIERSAEAANADTFIRQLGSGYDSEVGERGVQLSGGQRQRIGIARALLRKPGILILDEAMSALDTEAERLVREALLKLMEGRTTIIVSHRPSSFVHADRIVVLDGGRIVAMGRHEELERSSPVYRSLLGRAARAVRLAVTLAALVLLAPGNAAAMSAPAAAGAEANGVRQPMRGFVRDIAFALEVDGRQAPVELYKSEHAGAIVLLSTSFRSPLVLRAGVLATVDAAKVQKHPDATLDLAADAVLRRQGRFEITQDGVRFALDGHQANVRHLDQPPLLGLRRVDEVTAHNPEYLAAATSYVPNQAVLAALGREPRPVTVRVYYGSWCGHCRMLVPHAVKVEQQLRGSHIRFQYFGLRDPATDPEAKKAGVTLIPTAVVFVGGSEAGRIVSDGDWQALEVALRGILERQRTGR